MRRDFKLLRRDPRPLRRDPRSPSRMLSQFRIFYMRAHQLEHFISEQRITDNQTRSVANILVLVSGSLLAGLPLVTVVLQLDGISTLKARFFGGSSSSASDGSGDEKNFGELHNW